MECSSLCSFASREHRSERADYGIDAYSLHVSRLVLMQFLVQGRVAFPKKCHLPLAHTIEHEEFLEPDLQSPSTRDTDLNNYNLRSVLTIAFQFMFENHMRDNVAAMARQDVRSVVGSVRELPWLLLLLG
ncbi:hypothetical protein K1719_020237 [Acacia pycnantha]|nr:hypothetical protein K1719_020237 [Acacia pycnantha]